MILPEQYHVEPPKVPDEDRSGAIGQRLLKLLSVQVERNLRAVEHDGRSVSTTEPNYFDTTSRYFRHFAGGSAYAFAVLARFGESGKTIGGTSLEIIKQTALAMLCAVTRSHKLGRGKEEWSTFNAQEGLLEPESAQTHTGNWLNVDDRIGYVALSRCPFWLVKSKGRPCIWRGDGTMYDTCRLDFIQISPDTGIAHFEADAQISTFAMVTCPNQTGAETKALARKVDGAGWHLKEHGVLAIELAPYLVYANFTLEGVPIPYVNGTVQLAGETASYFRFDA